MFEFSIAIPAHDRGENGPMWMRELLDSLEKQTFQDFEVVVSDQSKNDDIMDVCVRTMILNLHSYVIKVTFLVKT